MNQLLLKARIAALEEDADAAWAGFETENAAGNFTGADMHAENARNQQSQANRLKKFIDGATSEGVGICHQ